MSSLTGDVNKYKPIVTKMTT